MKNLYLVTFWLGVMVGGMACARQGFGVYSSSDQGQYGELPDSSFHTTSKESGSLEDFSLSSDYRLVQELGLFRSDLSQAKPDVNKPSDADAGTVTWANDTCATAATIDLKLLAPGHPVSFTVNTSGATANYTFPNNECVSFPDVVIKAINSPGVPTLACNGGGHYCAMSPNTSVITCPPSGSILRRSGTCNGSTTMTPGMPQGTFYLVVWRAVTDGTAIITFSLD